MADRSSRPKRSPNQTARRTQRRIVALRVTKRWGPHRIGYHLHLPQSTVSKVLTRCRVPLLGHIDVNTGVRVRKTKPVRYERDNPGDLVHVDVKKLGRIPGGGGWRTLGRAAGVKNKKKSTPTGYSFLHSAIDDNSRVVYFEILENEKKETAAAFWERANTFYAGQPIVALAANGGSLTWTNSSCPAGTTPRYDWSFRANGGAIVDSAGGWKTKPTSVSVTINQGGTLRVWITAACQGYTDRGPASAVRGSSFSKPITTAPSAPSVRINSSSAASWSTWGCPTAPP
jgi:hypothetical protein